MKFKTFTQGLLFTFLFFQSSILFADHLSGGHVSYTCLGGDEFEIEFTIYRDCDSEGAPFDPQLSVATYTGNPNTQNYTLLNATYLQLGTTTLLNPQQCIINPSDACLEFAKYSFVTSLPSSTDSYFFVHQRCCRNHEITNLINPGEMGSTLFIELSPEAHTSCNSSPVFNIANPVQFCLGEAFTIEDIYAIDSDSDSIVYELSKPFVGAGPVGTPQFPGDPEACDAVMPNPACPPPYSFVEYESGYNELEALGSSSTLSINNLNGTISGIGQQIGDFIVGVCAKEYRNGVLLSTSTRDFIIDIRGLVATSELDQTSWEIFPQPASDHIFIKTNDTFSGDATLHLFDSRGVLMSEHSLNSSMMQRIETNHLNAGLHFYQVQKDGLVLQSGKLLKL